MDLSTGDWASVVITYLFVLSCLRVDDGKSLIDASYGQKIYICTKTLHNLSQRAPPTQTNNALNQQIPGTVLWHHSIQLGELVHATLREIRISTWQ